jgi:hypothetical protein
MFDRIAVTKGFLRGRNSQRGRIRGWTLIFHPRQG